ncbi:MAG TPA: ABC transporter substrate-binding protein, partial [Candidatus Binatia bacterium]
MRILGTVLSLCLLSASPARALDRLNVGYGSIGGGMWPAIVAQKKGLLAKNGIEATFIFIEGGTRALSAMIAGETPLLQVGGTEAIVAGVGGADVVIVSSMVNALSFDLVVAPEIHRVEDLKGKKLAVSRFGSTTDVGLKLALKKLGFDPKDALFFQIG